VNVRLLAGLVAAVAALSLGVAAGTARPASGVTINMIVTMQNKPGYDVLIANFERAYPNIDVNITYLPTAQAVMDLETTELAAGNAPELLMSFPACGTAIAICVLGKAGHLAPMLKKPWTKRSLPLVISQDKLGKALLAFTPTVQPMGIFTNDDRFKQLGLKVPQTFAQLLTVCQKAKAAGTAAVVLDGANKGDVLLVIVSLAVANVYGKDAHWNAKRRAGKVTFAGSQGWRRSLQQFVEMNTAGCFQPGMAGASAQPTLFARGQGLMMAAISSQKGLIDAAGAPPFRYSHHPFPGGTTATQISMLVNDAASVSVNADSSAHGQAAAQTFVDFIARPKQNSLFARIGGGLTHDEFMKVQLPDFMAGDASVLKQRKYVIGPIGGWWNAAVSKSLQDNQIGLITGQRSVDDVLHGMDAAWKQGPD
jgi:raffinose/stachyose/melibiose transport system substrate-binding protein